MKNSSSHLKNPQKPKHISQLNTRTTVPAYIKCFHPLNYSMVSHPVQTVLYDMMPQSGKTEYLPSDSLIKAKYFLHCMASDFPGLTRSNTKEMLLVEKKLGRKEFRKICIQHHLLTLWVFAGGCFLNIGRPTGYNRAAAFP